jgi:hypothetical protein
LFAPGVDIVSVAVTDDVSTSIRSGTSSAAPYVVGLVARYLSTRPGDQPDAVAQAIRNNATPGKVINPGDGSPNLLAFAAVTLSDDFNDNARDAKKWNTLATPDFTVAEQNGRLEITPAATSTNYDGYWAATNIDLTDARISVEGASVPTLPNYGSYLVLSDGVNYLLFGVGGMYNNLVMQQSVGGVLAQATVNYDATQHRFWRIRHNRAADTINWEASPDGVTWTTLHSAPRGFALTSLQTALMVRQYAPTSPAATTIYDNLRIERNEGGKAR